MYRNEPLDKYLLDAAAGTPAPGGGSIAAFVGALATTMVSMSAKFTVGKEEFKQFDSQLKKILEECEKSRETLLSLMEEDIKVYGDVNKALELSKSTEAEKNKRSEAIQKATIMAMIVPLKATMCCLYVLQQTRALVDIVNPNLISDVGVACYLADAAFQCARLNVEINLATINGQSLVEKVQDEIGHAEKKVEVVFKEIKERVLEKMRR